MATAKVSYFEWMYRTVTDSRGSKRNSYRKLLKQLDSIEFTWLLSDDENRAADGEEGLRWRYLYENNLEELDKPRGSCSVLEMILALAYKCEEIMDDTSYGDRTTQWFWNMITNLGLGGMYDSRYNSVYVKCVVERFLDRDFEPDGHGSLFVISNCRYDLRDVEIWTSMLWYLDSIT